MCANSSRSGSVTRVTACRKEDLPEIEAILQLSPEASAWSRSSLTEVFEQHSKYLLICWEGKHIAGFISGRAVTDEAEILNLAVKPVSRRRGVGEALVQALLELFGREGAAQVFLEVRESNAAAITFYERLGLCQIGRRPEYYRNPLEAALVLALRPGAGR